MIIIVILWYILLEELVASIFAGSTKNAWFQVPMSMIWEIFGGNGKKIYLTITFVRD